MICFWPGFAGMILIRFQFWYWYGFSHDFDMVSDGFSMFQSWFLMWVKIVSLMGFWTLFPCKLRHFPYAHVVSCAPDWLALGEEIPIPQWFGLNLGNHKFTLTTHNHIKIVSKAYQKRIKTISKSYQDHKNAREIDQTPVPRLFLFPLWKPTHRNHIKIKSASYQNRIKIVSRSYQTVSKPYQKSYPKPYLNHSKP